MTTILIVDNDQLNCDLLGAVLTRQGYHVVSCTSGREAVDAFERAAPRVTVVDVRMPDVDGLTVLKDLRAIDPEAPVILLGGGPTEEQENQARALRVTEFLRRGLSLDILVEAVHRAAQLPGPSIPTSIPPATAIGEAGESVLVVEHDPLIRDLLVQFLHRRGYPTTGCPEGPDAAQILEQARPDLVVVDLQLPGQSGLDLLRTLRNRDFPGGIILTAGSAQEELIEQAWALGPHELLTKPIVLDRLLTAVQLVLACREC